MDGDLAKSETAPLTNKRNNVSEAEYGLTGRPDLDLCPACSIL